MEKPFVSIVIPAFNAASTIVHTVEACKKQDYPGDKLEIIVVDDDSQDNTKDVVERLDIKCISQKRKGPAAARNNGWRNSKGQAICFTDADCIPEKDWVSKLVRHYDMNGIGAVAGSYTVHGSPYLLDKFVHYEIKNRHARMPEYIYSFGTYNVMIKKSILKATGGFNPEYCRASGEDTDLSYKIIKAGYKIYFAKDAFVSHKNILKFWKYIVAQFRHGYWRMKLYKGNSSMIIRDGYACWKDFLETSLVLMLFFFLSFNSQDTVTLFYILIAMLFLIQLPQAIMIGFQGRNLLYLGFAFVTFIRAFIRTVGGIFGFIKFWILRMG